MITLNGNSLVPVHTLPVRSVIAHTSHSGTAIILNHEWGEHKRVRIQTERGMMQSTLDRDALVRLIKAPPTWYP